MSLNPIQSHLLNQAQLWDDSRQDTSNAHLKSDINLAIEIRLAKFDYKFNDNDEFMIFDLLISKDGRCQSVLISFCETNGNGSIDCWETAQLPPNVLDLTSLLSVVINSSKGSANSFLVDFADLKRTEALIQEKIAYLTSELDLPILSAPKRLFRKNCLSNE